MNGALGRGRGTTDFYVTPDFWDSSTISGADAERISVPLALAHGATLYFERKP